MISSAHIAFGVFTNVNQQEWVVQKVATSWLAPSESKLHVVTGLAAAFHLAGYNRFTSSQFIYPIKLLPITHATYDHFNNFIHKNVASVQVIHDTKMS